MPRLSRESDGLNRVVQPSGLASVSKRTGQDLALNPQHQTMPIKRVRDPLIDGCPVVLLCVCTFR